MLLDRLGWLADQVNSLIPAIAAPPSVRSTDCQLDAILAQTGDDIRGRRRFTILPHPFRLDQPPVAVAGPVSLGKAPLRVEYPGLELALDGVPSDPLRAGEDRLALGLHGEIADQKVAVVAPLAGGVDDCVLALVDPVADQPFQLFETVVGAQVMVSLVADDGLEPLAVFLDVDDGEASVLG